MYINKNQKYLLHDVVNVHGLHHVCLIGEVVRLELLDTNVRNLGNSFSLLREGTNTKVGECLEHGFKEVVSNFMFGKGAQRNEPSWDHTVVGNLVVGPGEKGAPIKTQDRIIVGVNGLDSDATLLDLAVDAGDELLVASLVRQLGLGRRVPGN